MTTERDQQIADIKGKLKEVMMAEPQLLYEAAALLGDEIHTEGLAEEKGERRKEVMHNLGVAYALVVILTRNLIESNLVQLTKEHSEAIRLVVQSMNNTFGGKRGRIN